MIAPRWDAAARELVAKWGSRSARLLTAADLTSPGWRVHTDDPMGSTAVVQGEIVPAAEISGVFTRLPAITDRELPMLAAEDRAYAAAEMTAFLVYWLSSLTCPVLNAPRVPSLCGPGWRSEQWTMAASRLGLRVEPRQRRIPPFGTETPDSQHRTVDRVEVTVVGDRSVGADGDLARQARLLAGVAGVEMLVASFSVRGPEARFVDAHCWVDVRDGEVAEAILAYLSAGRRRP